MPKQLWAALLLSSVRARPYIKIAEPLQDAVVYGEATHEPKNRLGRDDAERRWIRIPELLATVSVPESMVPEDPVSYTHLTLPTKA